jgi:hypothetical protein
MDLKLYENIIAAAAPRGLKSVKLNFLGEPLLYKRLPEMISFASKFNLWVMMNTNAVALTPELSEKLLEAGLTDIFFSFDSPYRAEYESIRLGADYGKVLDNIAGFMAVKEKMGLKHVQTRASMVLDEGSAESPEIKADYIRLFRDLKVAEIGFGLPTVMDRDYAPLNEKVNFFCPDLFRRMFIFNDGLCGPCCGDWERRLIMGDATRSSVADIWNNEAYAKLRASHLSGDFKSEPACAACSVPHLSTMNV